jgi:hypothetical protein
MLEPRTREDTVESSVIYSMGTALNRAREHQLPVVVLVGNDWLRGTVRHLDSHGLVLAIAAHENCVIRLEAVNAVRLDAGTQQAEARVMPMSAAG